MPTPSKSVLISVIKRALNEDIGSGDITTSAIVPDGLMFHGEFIVKRSGILAGFIVADLTFRHIDKRVMLSPRFPEGSPVKSGDTVAEIYGPTQALLKAERVALNFLQRMSGIATLTRKFVEAVQGTSAVILDTRKTAPGLRVLDKWAVELGGGQNHRFGLYDMVLIKENHIEVAGSITEAIKRVRSYMMRRVPVEVEVKNIEEFCEAKESKPDRIMLDNMSTSEMREIVRLNRTEIPLEVSGNVGLENVREIAETGVDYISVGALTHSAKALDMSLLLKQ